MYKLLLALLMTVGMTMTMCAQQNQNMNGKYPDGKILIAYFSTAGTTARVVEKLVEAVGRDLYPIAPAQSYASTDLDWNSRQSRSSVEVSNPKMCPAIKDKKGNVGAHDVVFIGYPIWWGPTPQIVNTFIENHGPKGKTVVPFTTSEGNSIGNSATVLKRTCLDLNRKERRLLNRTGERVIRAWFDMAAVRQFSL